MAACESPVRRGVPAPVRDRLILCLIALSGRSARAQFPLPALVEFDGIDSADLRFAGRVNENERRWPNVSALLCLAGWNIDTGLLIIPRDW